MLSSTSVRDRRQTSYESRKCAQKKAGTKGTEKAGRGLWTLTDAGMQTALASFGSIDPVGVPHVSKVHRHIGKPSQPFEIDPDLLDHALQSHHDLVEGLATWLSDAGWVALDPHPGSPPYDLAWKDDSMINVAEVKSLTSTNEEHQLRLGLGQILRYQHKLSLLHLAPVQGWLHVEYEPTDSTWVALCDSLGLRLVWPTVLKES